MKKLESYVEGKWVTGNGDEQMLYDAVTGEEVGIASSKGLDFAAALDYGRKVGNPALRKMSFHDRGRMLKALALYLKKKGKVLFA